MRSSRRWITNPFSRLRQRLHVHAMAYGAIRGADSGFGAELPYGCQLRQGDAAVPAVRWVNDWREVR